MISIQKPHHDVDSLTDQTTEEGFDIIILQEKKEMLQSKNKIKMIKGQTCNKKFLIQK